MHLNGKAFAKGQNLCKEADVEVLQKNSPKIQAARKATQTKTIRRSRSVKIFLLSHNLCIPQPLQNRTKAFRLQKNRSRSDQTISSLPAAFTSVDYTSDQPKSNDSASTHLLYFALTKTSVSCYLLRQSTKKPRVLCLRPLFRIWIRFCKDTSKAKHMGSVPMPGVHPMKVHFLRQTE